MTAIISGITPTEPSSAKPVVIANDMPSVGSGNTPILFGDFSYYWIICRSPRQRPHSQGEVRHARSDRLSGIGVHGRQAGAPRGCTGPQDCLIIKPGTVDFIVCRALFQKFKECFTPISTAFIAYDFNLWVNYPFDFPKMRTLPPRPLSAVNAVEI